MTSLERLGFEGTIHPINPKRDAVLGHTCVPSVTDLPPDIDAIAFCARRDLIDANFADAARHGISAAALFATGFADAGDEGRQAEERLNALAREAGMSVVGPNGMGALNPATSSSLYSGIVEDADRLRGNVGVVTQSGAIAVGLLTDCRRYGFSHLVSSGNEAVTQLHEFMDHLIDDEATRVIALFVEAVRNPERFVAALDRAADRGKPVVVLKVGRSARAREAVLGHTGAIAGRGEAFSALLRRHRAIEVSTPDELNEVLAACQSTRLPSGPRIGHITASGGQVNMVIDQAEKHGFVLPMISDASRGHLEDGTGIDAAIGNPLDAWGNGDWQTNLPLALDVFAKDPAIDNVVFTSDTADEQPTRPTDYVGMVLAAADRSDKPFYFFNTRPGLFRQSNVEASRNSGVAVIGGVVQGLGAVHKLGVARSAPAPTWLAPVKDAPSLADHGERASINETDAKALLAQAGIVCAREQRVNDEAEAAEAARTIGFPLVLKAVSDEIAHRSDHGLVAVGISDAQTFERERERMLAVLDGMDLAQPADLVASEQVAGGVEVLVGVTRDPEVGAYLAVGLGGTLVELLDEAALRPLPLCEGDAEAMIDETRLSRLLAGVRGGMPLDRAALVKQIETVARLAHAWGASLEELDINPLIVAPEGAVVADAVIFPSRADAEPQ